MTEVAGRVGQQRPRRFPPYPAYKESGVQWLGEIPATWDIAPVYARYEVALGKMLDAKRDTGESSGKYLRNVDVQWDAVNIDGLPEMDFPSSDRNRYLLRRGDLLVCEGGEVGRTAIWGGELDECFYQKAIHRVRPWSARDVPRFFYFLMYAMAKRGVFTAGGNPNTIDHLTAVQLRRYRVPIPPATEKRAIVAFLDRETAKIDALVARKERLMELLQEKRTALITRAVTRGLDPNVAMKDSGVEWLGEIPAHWEVKRLKHVTPRTTVGIVVTPSKYYVDEGIPCLRSLNVSRGAIVMEDLVFISEHANELHRKSKIFAGDLVVVRTGQAGTAAVVPKELDGANCIDLLIVRRSGQLLSDFVYYYLNSRNAISQAAELSVGAIQAHYNTSTLARLIVPEIPTDEQGRVVAHLDAATGAIDRLVETIRQAIDHLNEFRTAVISAAVTGKIDVYGGGDAMSFEPSFTVTHAITADLTRIERARGFLEAATLSEDWNPRDECAGARPRGAPYDPHRRHQADVGGVRGAPRRRGGARG